MKSLFGAFACAGAVSCASPEEVPLHTVRRETFVREVEAEGFLRASTSTPVGVPHSPMGALKLVFIVDDGSEVKEGQVVARFDETGVAGELLEGSIAYSMSNRKIEQRQVKRESTLANVEGDRRLAALELDFARRFGQKDPEIFSRVQILESRIDERLAAEKVSNAEGRRETEEKLAASDVALLGIERDVAAAKSARAREALQALEVRAPHDGILILVRDWRGSVARPGTTTYSGQTIAEIPALDRMEAAVSILEADAGGVKEGAKAAVAVEGRSGGSVAAVIRRVDRMPKPRLRGHPVQYFEAILDLEATDARTMKPGQRVVAKLRLDERDGVLAVPRQAVLEDEGGTFVYRRVGGGFEKTKVRLGAPSLGRIEIESGLSESDVVAARDPKLARGDLAPATDETPREEGTP